MADEEVIVDEEIKDEEDKEEVEKSLLNKEPSDEEDKGEEVKEGKADSDEKADDSSDKSDKKDEKTGAPDDYDFKAPEGFGELDPEAMEQFTPVAKELDLTQEQAQKVVNLYGDLTNKAVVSQQKAWADQLKSWKEEATNDTEIGGQAFQTNVIDANRAIDVFGNEELREVMDSTGMGNNVEVIRLLSKVGAALKDDNVVFGKGTGDQSKSPESIMYPDMNQGAK